MALAHQPIIRAEEAAAGSSFLKAAISTPPGILRVMKPRLTASFVTLSLGVCLGVLALQFQSPAVAQEVSLGGVWRFQLDRSNQGIQEQWWSRSLAGKARLPGDLAAQGIGDPPSLQTPWVGGIQNRNWSQEPSLQKYAATGNFKFPYWLTPERYYSGAAWF